MKRDESSDLITGASAIAAHLGWSRKTLKSNAAIMPLFRVGARLCARRSSLEAWLIDRELAALSDDHQRAA